MVFKICGVFLVLCTARTFAQYQNMNVRPESYGVPYEKTQQEIVNNFLNNKPLLNYIPVYTTEYGHWNGENEESVKTGVNKNQQPTSTKLTNNLPSADLELQKLGQIITRLKNDLVVLSHQAKEAYDDKFKELEQVKKLYQDLMTALQNTDILKNNLSIHGKQLKEFTKNIQNGSNSFSKLNQFGVEQFLKMIEGLEMMVRNISNKYGKKLGV